MLLRLASQEANRPYLASGTLLGVGRCATRRALGLRNHHERLMVQDAESFAVVCTCYNLNFPLCTHTERGADANPYTAAGIKLDGFRNAANW